MTTRKTTPLGPYLYHLYAKFGCLRKEEQEEWAAAKDCLELGLEDEEAEEDPDEEEESEGRSVSLKPQSAKSSPRPRLKTTFHGPKDKEPMRSLELKDLSFLDLEDEPFKRIQLELDQEKIHYTKLETVVTRAARLLGDCKAENIGKEIRRLKAEDSAALKTEVEKLKLRVCEQQGMMKNEEEQIAKLKADWAGL